MGRAGGDRAPGPGPGAAAVPAVRHLRRLPVAARDTRRAARGQARDRRARARRAADRRSSPPSPPFGYRDRAKLAVGQGGDARVSRAAVARPRRRPRVSAVRPRAGARAAGAARARARPGGRRRDRRAGRRRRRPPQRRRRPIRPARRTRDAEIDRLGAAGVVGLSLAGKPTLGRPDVDVAEPGSPPLRIPADGFAQVGRAGNAALVAAVMEAVGPRRASCPSSTPAAGTSPATWCAPARRPCAASDGDPAAIARGARNVPEAAWSLRPPAGAADTVVLDPPREGADKRAPGGRGARAPARRLRLMRSADAAARRARAEGRRLRADGRRGAGPHAADLPRRGRRDVRSRRRDVTG